MTLVMLGIKKVLYVVETYGIGIEPALLSLCLHRSNEEQDSKC